MRTTLEIEDDVAALLESALSSSARSLEEVVNDALRRGLRAMLAAAPELRRYDTPTSDLGQCLIVGFSDMAETLAAAEGEDFR